MQKMCTDQLPQTSRPMQIVHVITQKTGLIWQKMMRYGYLGAYICV
jgi:hypothetical protein